ncbi:serine-repeat antigen [Plasmodium malariae]|uniref:Papain-like cysteine prorease n=1 Tax=Plasmodium malariae TaxID=5858 RepID=F1SYS0_PLAMA|nr:putative papain-like cysteine prorease [Plasmodium malariae]SBS96083.1 serine-repeat antigen [Plasmodium malariae]
MKCSISFFLIIYIILSRDIFRCKGEDKAVEPTQGQSGAQGSSSDTEGRANSPSVDGSHNGPLSVNQQTDPKVTAPTVPSTSNTQTGESNFRQEVASASAAAGDRVDASGSGASSIAVQSATPSSQNNINVKSALLKDHKGVKVTGTCNAKVQLFLVPHISITLETKESKIRLGPKYEDSDITKEFQTDNEELDIKKIFEIKIDKLQNRCADGKTFKFIAYLQGEELTLKWKVYDNTTPPNKGSKTDIMNYLIKNLDRPITAIQVHTTKNIQSSFLIESKNYSITNSVPEKCELMAMNCFLSGSLNMENCYSCAVLLENDNIQNNECFNYTSAFIKENIDNIKARAQDDDENPTQMELTQKIDNILKKMYKMDNNNNMQLITLEGLDDTLKGELVQYCKLLKEVDTSGTLESYEMGNETEIFNNLTRLLAKHADETYASLQHKLRNAAICMKNVNDWIKNKRGLSLPQFEYHNLENNSNNLQNYENSTQNVESKNVNSVKQNEGYDGVIDFSDYNGTNMNSSQLTDTMYCNKEYCDRWKDNDSCFSKIEAAEQGNCAISWLFASKLHLETIRCMNRYDHVKSSALYIANCSKRNPKDKCISGSNPFEYLSVIEENGFLPLEHNHPYSYKEVANDCPKSENHWTNLWAGAKLVDSKDEPNSLGAKGYTAYESDKFRGNIDTFIKKIKHEVMHKGSVIAYVKAENAMDYDLNGKKVLSLCGDKNADHAINIIGWGNYTNDEGKKKSYWIIRNSWGKYWGDEGNFRVDMHGPEQCEHNFIHSAVIFNIHMPIAQVPTKKGAEIYNYYLKTSPDFYSNLYYNNFTPEEESVPLKRNDLSQNSLVYGQDEPAPALPTGSASGERASPGVGGVQGDVSSTLPKSTEQNGPQPGNAAAAGQIQSTHQESQPGQRTPVETSVDPKQSVLPGSQTVAAKNAPAATAKTGVLHVLKHIKNGQIKMGLVKYEDNAIIIDNHACSRSYAMDVNNLDECIKFCSEEWDNCKDEPSPGYCLTKRQSTNKCFFCYV